MSMYVFSKSRHTETTAQVLLRYLHLDRSEGVQVRGWLRTPPARQLWAVPRLPGLPVFGLP